jgi:hypothetical protein
MGKSLDGVVVFSIIGSSAGIWYGLLRIVLGISALVSSQPLAFSDRSGAAKGWIVISLGFASAVVGMLTGNFLVGSIPAARRTLDATARQSGGASYQSSQKGLWFIGRYILALALAISFAVAVFVR